MKPHLEMTDKELRKMIKNREVCIGGNRKLKIYGRLDCRSGKKMSRKNRVFFNSEQEAKDHNYRPCGHCLREKYLKWKHETI